MTAGSDIGRLSFVYAFVSNLSRMGPWYVLSSYAALLLVMGMR